jgi:hypothetical protein
VELAEVTRRKDAQEQRAQAEHKNVAGCPRIEGADVHDQQIPNYRVEESPNDVDRRRGESLAGRFRKGSLKGAPHGARDKVRNGVRHKCAPKEVRHKP